MTQMHLVQDQPGVRNAVCIDSPSEPGTIPFDRRCERRSAVNGYASVICLDAFKTLLSGTMRLGDVAPSGAGLLSSHALEPGDVVEVRLAPYKVKGRVGIVRNCTPLGKEIIDDQGIDPWVYRYRIGVQYQRAIRAA